MNIRYLLVVLIAMSPMVLANDPPTGDAADRIRAAQARIGSLDPVRGGWVFRGEGRFDLSARHQGLDGDEPHWVPYEEVLAFDADRLVYESRGRVNADADEWLRYRVDGRGVLLSERINQRAFWLSDMDPVDTRLRYRRFLPDALLSEALSAAEPSTRANPSRFHGEDAWQVPFRTLDGTPIALYLNEDHRLLGFSYELDMPLLGDTVVTWRYTGEHELGQDVKVPTGYEVRLGQRLMKQIRFARPRLGDSLATWMAMPDGMTEPEQQPEGNPDEPEEAPSDLQFQSLAEGVWVAPNTRPGFHVLVVEAGNDGLIVVDAPAGWFELQQVPAMNWVPGATSSSTAIRLLENLKRQFPERRVSHVVLTHHHSDHAGGVRPFIAAGAVVVASSETRRVVERAVKASFTLAPDPLSATPMEPVFELVDKAPWRHASGLEVHPVPGNPHARGMLVVYLPAARLIYQSDLFEPVPDPYFPSRERVPAMAWFVDWLDQFQPPVDQVIAIHGSLRVTPAMLDRIRAER